ncbi:MAG: molecular chaperone [Campylobacteraceae bacterium]
MEKSVAIEQARALYYKFFAIVFGAKKSEKEVDDLIELLGLFMQNPMDEASLDAVKNMSEFLRKYGLKGFKEECDDVFTSPESSFVPFSASYFDEGRDDGEKRVESAGYVFESKFRKNELNTNDSEDTVAFLFSFMQTLLNAGKSGDSESLALAKKMFEKVLNEFLDDFSSILFSHESAFFYKNVAVLLYAFTEFERFYLDVAKSQKSASKERASAVIQKDRKPLTQKVRRNLDEIVL